MKQCRVRLEIRQLFTTDPRSGEHGRGGNQTTTATGRGQSVNAVTRQQILKRDFSTHPHVRLTATGKQFGISVPGVARKRLTFVSCPRSLAHWQSDYSEGRFVCSFGICSNHHLGPRESRRCSIKGANSARNAGAVTTNHCAAACSFSACATLVIRPANTTKTRVSIFLMGRNTPLQPARLDQSAKLFAASSRCPRTGEQASNSIRTGRRHGSKEMPERLDRN